jgi:hypothetical protein
VLAGAAVGAGEFAAGGDEDPGEDPGEDDVDFGAHATTTIAAASDT